MPMMSPDDRRALASRAADIYERAAALDPSMRRREPTAAAVSALQSWTQSFSPGDPGAFARRLSWDGLDVATVLAAADPPPPADTTWTAVLDRVLIEAGAIASEMSSGAFARDPLLVNVPFEEVWSAFTRTARAMLDDRLDAAARQGVAPAAMRSAERQLAREISLQGELALFERFQAQRAAELQTSSDRYAAFVTALLRGGLVPFFVEHAALARQLCRLTADWVDGAAELFARACTDRGAMAEAFCHGADPGAIEDLEAGLSDPHHGRRRVAILRFSSGHRIVYKPRGLALDRAFADLLAWINARIDVPLPILRVVDRGSHGWVEAAEHGPALRREDVARYFEQSGSLACVAYLLRGIDLHMENVIATPRGPVLVDVEMLLQPISRAAARLREAVGTDAASAFVDDSSLATGLITLVDITDDGRAFDSSGLRGQHSGQLPFPRRVWKDLRTDTLRFDLEGRFTTPGRHRVMFDGVLQSPEDHADRVVTGFTNAYRALVDGRAALAEDDGLLAPFASGAPRVLIRPTNQYGMLLHVLASPKYQRDGIRRSTAVDVLYRSFAGSGVRPELWPVVVEERRALQRLDVPYFSLRGDGTEIRSGERALVAGYYVRSGLDAVRARAAALSARDLAFQAALVRRALSESVHSRFSASPPPAGDLAGGAEWIARELIGRADRGASQLRWRYRPPADRSIWEACRLYDGEIGPAIFLAALAQTTGGEEWRRHAHAALDPIATELEAHAPEIPETENIGGMSGLGSIVYSLSLIGACLGDDRAIGLARRVAGALGARAGEDAGADVVDGAAGAALALLALHAVTGEPRWLEDARAFGDDLLARAVDGGDQTAWRSSDGHLLVGFAHGAAGIAFALRRLFDATGDRRFADGARRASVFVHRQYVPALGNYAIAGSMDDARAGEGRVMTTWCHGAPGVVLGTAPSLDFCENPAILSGFEAAMRTTARLEPAQADHLCCGVMGRADALLTAGRGLRRPEVEAAAQALSSDMLGRAVSRGHFRLSGAGVEYRVFDPGFFRGLSGIGYQLLRMTSPSRLPSIPSLEPPGASGSTRQPRS